MHIRKMTGSALVLGLFACSAPGPQPQVPGTGATPAGQAGAKTGAGSAVASEATGEKASAPKVGLVAQKPGVVVADAQWLSPASTIDRLIGSAVRQKATVTDEMFEKVKRNVVKDILRNLLGSQLVNRKALAAEVSLSHPFRAVLAANLDSASMSKPMTVVSIPLRSLQPSLAALKNAPEQMGEGVWLITAPEGAWQPGHCGIVAARDVPARLICGDKKRDVTTLGPYVARNLADKPLQGGDMVAQLNVRPLLDRYGDGWKPLLKGLPAELRRDGAIGQPIFDAALTEAGEALAAEAEHLLDEVHGARVVVSVDKGIRTTAEFKWSGAKSWLAQGMVALRGQQGPAPAMFWQLPANASSAYFSRTADPARTAGMFRIGTALAEGLLVKAKVPKMQRTLLTGLLRHPLKKAGSVVSASGSFGMDPGAPPPAKALDALIGWNVTGLDQNADSLKAWLGDFVRAFNDRSLRARLKKETKEDASNFVLLKRGVAPLALGAGGMAIELTLPKKGKKLLMKEFKRELRKAPKQLRNGFDKVQLGIHLLVAADGNRTWVAIGSNKKKLAALLANIKKGGCLGTVESCSAGRDKLGSISRLAEFKTGSYVSGSYSSLRPLLSLANTAANMAAKAAPPKAKGPIDSIKDILDSVPNGARSPIISKSKLSSGMYRAETHIPQPAVEDIQHIVAGALKMFFTMGSARKSGPHGMPTPPPPPPATN